MVDVREESSGDCNRARRADTTESSKDDERGPVGRDTTGHGEDCEKDKGSHHHGSPSIQLAHRSENQRTSDISDQVDRGWQHLLCLAVNIESAGDELDSAAWDG